LLHIGTVMIVRLDQVRYEDGLSERLGGKGAGLVRLMGLGLPVPPAVAVPVDEEGRLEDPGDVADLLGEPLAVRSSAVGEDASDRSAAGQYESLMGVTRDQLSQAVREVYRSADLERARAYRGTNQAAMAVVIQRQVRPSRAGVAFSRDPVSGADEVVIECVFGHGEELVSGRRQPDRYRVPADGAVQAELAIKEEPYRLLRSLRDDEVRVVANLTRRAEEGFGAPVDVEFCFEGTNVWLVQCRAITTLG
jgi:phosphoenolpyruvate synthase/pyruvate phosphate dikinase